MGIIEVDGLKKFYGEVKAVDGVSFEVFKGEIFGMVGPNGAGKTTTIECIEGLRKPDAGNIVVLGLNPYKERERLYKRIGVQLQETNYDPRVKVWEICELFSSFYKNPIPYNSLLERFNLLKKRNSFVSKLSGGQRQKLSIILALIPDPEIVFLDELTTGLDPKARRDMWEFVKNFKEEGRTVFLTTHYMEEAEYLCDRVLIMDGGRIVALDTPENLIKNSGIENRIIFEGDGVNIEKLKEVKGVIDVKKLERKIIVYGRGENFVQSVISFLNKEGVSYNNLNIKNPNLEDVFLKLTGHEFEEGKDEGSI